MPTSFAIVQKPLTNRLRVNRKPLASSNRESSSGPGQVNGPWPKLQLGLLLVIQQPNGPYGADVNVIGGTALQPLPSLSKLLRCIGKGAVSSVPRVWRSGAPLEGCCALHAVAGCCYSKARGEASKSSPPISCCSFILYQLNLNQ